MTQALRERLINAGRVLVDGVDVREVKLDQLRRSVSVIFQETFLFSTTVTGGRSERST